jgi:hypothetical protein
MSSRKTTSNRSHLPTGTLGKNGFIRTTIRKKSILGPSYEENKSRPDAVVPDDRARVRIQSKTAEDEVPRKKSVLGPSREEDNSHRPNDVSDRARVEIRPETTAAEDEVPQYEYYSEILRREMELRLERKEAKLAAWYHARYRREVDDAVAAELGIALSAALQEMNVRHEITERETRARLDADFRMRVLEGVSESHNVSRFPSNGGVNIVSSLSRPGDVWSVLLAVKPSRSPYRTISNPDVGDPSRAFLGENGTLEVHVNIASRVRRAVYYDDRGNVKFMAECPPARFPFSVIQGNAGMEPLFVWDAVNEAHASGGTTIRGAAGQAPGLRRFFFHFATNATLAVTLHHIMYGNSNFTEEFFYPKQGKKNRFFKGLNLPAHDVVSTLSSAIKMNSPNVRRIPVNAQWLTRKYNGVDPTMESQAM